MIKKSMTRLLVGLAVVAVTNIYGSDNNNSTQNQSFFQPRPASANIAREMLMQPSLKNRNVDSWYGEFSATGFYQRSWNQNGIDGLSNSTNSDNDGATSNLGMMPFWSGSNTMTVGNNLVASSSASTAANIDAYQLGLGNVVPGTTAATITLDPIIYQAGADFMFIVGASQNEPGVLFKIKAPLTVYNINPQLTSSNDLTAQNYTGGQIAVTDAIYNPLAQNIIAAFAGNTQNGQIPQGNVSPMEYGLINGDQTTGVRFADIEMTFGYTFMSDEYNSVVIGVRASAPTGNKAEGIYMLEPIVGRNGCWGLGGYASANYTLWEGSKGNSFTFKFMGDLMHLFNSNSMRSYDLLANGQGSRYLLVANYQNGAYQNYISNLINLTTLASDSSFGVEGDIAFALNYSGRGFGIDLGYEFFGRSAEQLTITGALANQQFAILGRQSVALANGNASTLCQPTAQIGKSVDHSDVQTAYVLDATIATNRIGVTNATNANELLDVASAAQKRYLSSKVFAKVAYEWTESDLVPFLGVIGEFEMSNCGNNALPQWGIVLVGGISF